MAEAKAAMPAHARDKSTAGTPKKPASLEARRYNALYKGLHLVFTNKFVEAEAHFEKHARNEEALPPSLRASHLVLLGFVKFFRALSTWGKGAIDKALEVMWEAEALAGKDTEDKLGAKLTQAHAFFQGAFLQILQKRFAKAAWNIRSSWKCFQGAMTDLENFKGSAELKAEHEASAKLGVGAFNLILSFMPPIIITVTKVLGFSADRVLGMKLLREAYASQRLMSPIAGQVMLFYLTTISTVLAEQTEAMRREAELVLDDILKRHPNGLFILWTKTSYLRSCRKHEEAIKVSRIAAAECKDAPALAMMSEWQGGWCYMLLHKFKETKQCFQKILESEHKATQDGVPGFYCYTAGISAVNAGDCKEGVSLLQRVEKEARNLDIPHEQYAVRAAVRALKSLGGVDVSKAHECEKFLCACYLAQMELILEWNFVKYMPDDVRKTVEANMDVWHSKRTKLGWKDRELAWYHLMSSHLAFWANDKKKALEQGVTAVAYAKRAKDSTSTLLAQCYFTVANIYLEQDPPDFDRAQKKCTRAKEKCTGDLAKRMNFLIHAMKTRIARLRKQAKSKSPQEEKETEEETGIIGGTMNMVTGAVGGAVNWGWGAIAGGDGDESDDAVDENKLEKT